MLYNHITFRGAMVALLAYALTLPALSGCTKQHNQQEAVGDYARVTFSIAGVRDGDIGARVTKGGTLQDELSELLASTRPTETPTLSIRSTTISSRRYEAQAGQPISLPLDTYTITGQYTPIIRERCSAGPLFKTPSYEINQTVVVGEGDTEFSLSAQYTCFAIVLDGRECTGYRHYYITNQMVDLEHWVENGQTKLVYVCPEGEISSAKPYQIQALPVDLAEHEAQTYKITSAGGPGFTQAVNGRWYCFSPKSVDTASGDIGVGFPDWEQGTIQ